MVDFVEDPFTQLVGSRLSDVQGVHFDGFDSGFTCRHISIPVSHYFLGSVWFRNRVAGDGADFPRGTLWNIWRQAIPIVFDNGDVIYRIPESHCQEQYWLGADSVTKHLSIYHSRLDPDPYQDPDPDMAQGYTLQADSDFPPIEDGNWHHLIAFADTHSQLCQVYIDDVFSVTYLLSLSIVATADGSFEIRPSPPFEPSINDGTWHFSIGYLEDPGNDLSNFSIPGVDVAELWWSPISVPFDLTIEKNRRKFLTSGGAPAALGTHGELPLDGRPAVYGSGGGDTFLSPNLGTVQSFFRTGSISNATAPVRLRRDGLGG